MPKTLEIQAYEFHELSPRAKERVVQKMWQNDYTWWDVIFDDFVIVAGCLGFEVASKQRAVRSRKGPATYVVNPEIFFEERYGWSAGFSGTWRLLDATQAVKDIKGHCEDEHLVRLAVALEAELTQFALVGLETLMREGNVTVKIVGNAHGIQTGSDSCEWISDYQLADQEEAAAGSLGVTVEATAKDLAKWLAKQLEAEAEYRQSEEAIKETCDANEYLFDEHGEML